jgi:DNA-binding PadR family transcriptional regulator
MHGLVRMAVLKAIVQTPTKAYGAAITLEVSKLLNRELSDAQVYVALSRLEQSGLINSHLVEIPVLSKKSRGRPRKFYALSAKGERALESASEVFPLGSRLMQAFSWRHEDEGVDVNTKATSPPVVV